MKTKNTMIVVLAALAGFAVSAFAQQNAQNNHSIFRFHGGQAIRENLGPIPRWLSTAGLGVPWLHLRLDTRPKYYQYGPYKNAA